MRALQLEAIGQLTEVRVPVPSPLPDEVLVRTVATTICTSDLHDIEHNPFGIVLPRVLGHEGAGVVVAAGDAVESLQAGDRVTAHPVIPCRQCENCRRGLGHLCSNLGHLGLDRDGTFAEFFCIRADRARRLPPEVDFRFASLLEPVAVCLEAIRRGRLAVGETVLVIGDGPFGILIARLALQSEPQRVIVVGRHQFRLRHVTRGVVIHEKQTADVRAAIRETNEGQGVDVVILATGSPGAFELALGSVRARGRVVLFSAVHSQPKVDWFRLHTQELDILGACNDQDLIDPALACLADPELHLDSLVTQHLPFAEWRRGFELARFGKDEALKVALEFGEP
ncbi:MAG: alcohol dehydrogenase catalytic domain-containing protein [Verrucomicrobia bacterium]|nr:alcohol dehydrogenase catalytic domain-containing protein [Verrucomicrobiota bacterium]